MATASSSPPHPPDAAFFPSRCCSPSSPLVGPAMPACGPPPSTAARRPPRQPVAVLCRAGHRPAPVLCRALRLQPRRLQPRSLWCDGYGRSQIRRPSPSSLCIGGGCAARHDGDRPASRGEAALSIGFERWRERGREERKEIKKMVGPTDESLSWRPLGMMSWVVI